MKKQVGIFIVFFLVISSHTIAQKILLKIGSVTAAGGEEVRAVDFKIDAATSWVLGGGVSVGRPRISEFLIKKTNNTSTNDMYKKILLGMAYTEVILEYYDAANQLYFKITLKGVFVSNFYWLSPECPTCLKLEHQVAFVPEKIETFDVATGITVGYDVPAGKVY